MDIKTIIVDDEPLSRKRISKLLQDYSDITIIEECSTGKRAIEAINTLEPTLIFMDIELKDMTGFNVLEKVNKKIKPFIIFITAFDEYSIKAFDFFALDYLLKPFKDDRFYKSTNKAIEMIKNNQLSMIENKMNQFFEFISNQRSHELLRTKIPIKISNKTVFVENDSIKYIIASGYYAEIFTKDKKYLLRDSLSNLIKQLNSTSFLRIHRSTIINLNNIVELINSNYGEIDVKMDDNKLFRISKGYKKSFISVMGL